MGFSIGEEEGFMREGCEETKAIKLKMAVNIVFGLNYLIHYNKEDKIEGEPDYDASVICNYYCLFS